MGGCASAPNSPRSDPTSNACRWATRAWSITPAGRGAGGKGAKQDANAEAPAVPKHVAMSWAQRLKRVFAIEIDTCARCQGRLRVIASIEEPEVIARILAHRERDCGAAEPELAPIVARAPPRQGRLL